MQQTNINQFFEYLAERKYHENDLSDITYALCKSNEKFKKIFLKSCFPKEIDEDLDTKDLVREYTVKDSRPDFYFHDLKGGEKLIEVKIFDKDIHPKYKTRFKNATRAFIANYHLDKKEGWDYVTTWHDFYTNLTKEEILKDDPFVFGYMNYLSKVTEIKRFKKMDLSSYEGLPCFYQNLESVAQDYNLTPYNSSNSFDSSHYGRYFLSNHKNKLYFWFGLNLKEEVICIGFFKHKTWVPEAIQKKIKGIVNKNVNCYETKESELGDFWFELKDKKDYETLCDKNASEEKQKNILKNFLYKVFSSIGAEKYLS